MSITPLVLQTALPLPLHHRGKVRDIYAADGRLLFIASDRISAFDVVLPNGIPDKGLCLTQVSNFWFKRFSKRVPNHVLASKPEEFPSDLRPHLAALEGRSVLVRRAKPLRIECIARGYVAGSGWKDYQRTGAICGIPLPKGLRQAEELPEPIFTPSTKAEKGHDENIPFAQAAKVVGKDLAERVRELTLSLYSEARAYAARRGILIADTKFEFGTTAEGELLLIDECLTPDSSRFWPAEEYEVGASPPSFDKQYVRDWLEGQAWDKKPPAPRLPDEVVAGTARRYRQAFESLSGLALEEWRRV